MTSYGYGRMGRIFTTLVTLYATSRTAATLSRLAHKSDTLASIPSRPLAGEFQRSAVFRHCTKGVNGRAARNLGFDLQCDFHICADQPDQRWSFLESGLTVETKVKPDSRKDTVFYLRTLLRYLSSEEFDGLVDCSESDNAFSIALYNSSLVFVL
jgi:hypothetical protein